MKIITPKPLKRQPQIAIVVSQFNEEVTSRLLEGALVKLKALLVEDALVVWVPGAVEIPLAVQKLASSKNYDAIIALGAVIRGETSHYDYVCKQVSDGCRELALKHDLPVIFGVLTTEDEQQAMDRAGGAQGNKGADAVEAAFAMISILHQIHHG